MTSRRDAGTPSLIPEPFPREDQSTAIGAVTAGARRPRSLQLNYNVNNSGISNAAPPIPPKRFSKRLKSTAERQSWSKPSNTDRIQAAIPKSPELAPFMSRAVSDSDYQSVVWAASEARTRKSWSKLSARDAPPPIPAKKPSLRLKHAAVSRPRRRSSWSNTTVKNAPPPVPEKKTSQRVKHEAVSRPRRRSSWSNTTMKAGPPPVPEKKTSQRVKHEVESRPRRRSSWSNTTMKDAPPPVSQKRASARVESPKLWPSRARSLSADTRSSRSRSLSDGSTGLHSAKKTSESPQDNSAELGVYDETRDLPSKASFSQSSDNMPSRYSSFRGFGNDSPHLDPASDTPKSPSQHSNLSGYLEKGGGGKAKQPRYFFVLTGHDLVYYKDYAAKAEEPDHPLGAYDLRGSSVEEIVTETKGVDGTTLKKWRFFLSWPLPDMGDPAVFEWGVEEQSTDIILTAGNQTEFKRWTQALRSAIATAGKVSDDEYTDSDSESASDAEEYFGQTKTNGSSSSGSLGAKGDEEAPPQHTAQPTRGEARAAGNARSWTRRRRSPRQQRSKVLAKKHKRAKKRRGWFKIFRKRGKKADRARKTSNGYGPVPESNNIDPDHYDNELMAVMTRIERKMKKRERKHERSALFKPRAPKKLTPRSPRLSPKTSPTRSPKLMPQRSPHSQMSKKMSPQMIRVASMESQPQTSTLHSVWSMSDMFTPVMVDTPSTDSPIDSVQHCLYLMRQELAATRKEMVAQREHFQRQLDMQSEQIRLLQENLQAFVTKL